LLAILSLLDELGVDASVAVGHGVGELAGLVWADCTTAVSARALVGLRSAAVKAPRDSAPGELAAAIGKYGASTFQRPRRRLISGCTGREITAPDEIAEVLSAELFDARIAAEAKAGETVPDALAGPERALNAAILKAAEDAVLVMRTGEDPTVARLVAALGMSPVSDGQPGSPQPTVCIDGDPAEDDIGSSAAAALFAAGAMTKPEALYAACPSRPIDIWRDPVFIEHPCQRSARPAAASRTGASQTEAQPTRAESQDAESGAQQSQAEPKPAEPKQAAPTGAEPTGAEPTQDVATEEAPAAVRPSVVGRLQAAASDVGPETTADTVRQAANTQAVSAVSAASDPPSAASDPASDAGDPADADGDPPAVRTKAGSNAWFRCYAEQTEAPVASVPVGDDRPWRLYTGGCGPLQPQVRELFRHDPAASRTLVVLGELDDPASSQAAVLAVKDAIGTGQLVAITARTGVAGLWATLHAEHPETGVTAIRAPMTADGIAAAQRVAVAAPGEFRELVIGEDRTVTEPVMRPVKAMGGADFPLGADDVVLISRCSGAAGLTLAQVLACSGAAVAIVGRTHPAGDEQVIAGIDKLRGAGAKVAYELVDLADHAAVVAAVRRIEARFGCVTAIGHATGTLPRAAIADLTPEAVHEQVQTHTAPLDQLAAAVRAVARSGSSARRGSLGLIVTCGSVTGRYGLPAESAGAYATCALADFAKRSAAASPGCRALHIDWPAWAGEALGERDDLGGAMVSAGYSVMQVGEGSRLMLKALATDELPARVAIHGRVGVPAPRPIAVTGTLGQSQMSERFIERVLVHYPGVELIAEARLSLLADPYLLDYQADGVPILPPIMALEAMAQVAAALAGTPVRLANQVAMRAPVVLAAGMPGSQTVIRIYAIKEGDVITIRVRSDNSGFAVDHCRATFSLASHVPDDRPWPGFGQPAGTTVPAEDFYNNVLFQTGRFRLLREVSLAGPRSTCALAAPAGTDDHQPWFGAVPPARAGDATRELLVLGDAGLADAALQVVQAWMPGRRMLVSGCDSVWFSEAFGAGNFAGGQVTIAAGQDPASAADAVPRQRAGEGEGGEGASGPAWRVRVTDADERILIAWEGLRMRDAGPLLPSQPEASQPAAEQPANYIST
ncbi:MAG: SDR family NAD(P)-dependent oxidoreductase, partial [Nocardiopsaceae bacterium]|nr:SDR family NAD(P)-dependent oxidoreductase [Nocardiopsaceae bacterium]